MDILTFPLKYTICFCVAGSKILMLLRTNEPNKNKWNGLGGKIERGETPTENVIREMQEEAEIDLRKAEELRFAGIVTWNSTRKEGIVNGGMFAYIARLASDNLFEDRETREGLLSWKEIAGVCDKKHSEVAENIFYFLPKMLTEITPKDYHCTYVFGKLENFKVKTLSLSSLTV